MARGREGEGQHTCAHIVAGPVFCPRAGAQPDHGLPTLGTALVVNRASLPQGFPQSFKLN